MPKQLTPETLRKLKNGMVATPEGNELFEHPMITATPQGTIIAVMAMNTAYESLARYLESDEGDNAE